MRTEKVRTIESQMKGKTDTEIVDLLQDHFGARAVTTALFNEHVFSSQDLSHDLKQEIKSTVDKTGDPTSPNVQASMELMKQAEASPDDYWQKGSLTDSTEINPVDADTWQGIVYSLGHQGSDIPKSLVDRLKSQVESNIDDGQTMKGINLLFDTFGAQEVDDTMINFGFADYYDTLDDLIEKVQSNVNDWESWRTDDNLVQRPVAFDTTTAQDLINTIQRVKKDDSPYWSIGRDTLRPINQNDLFEMIDDLIEYV